MKKLINGKKGWIKIVEAFIAIAFIIGVLTVFGFSNQSSIEEKTSSRIMELQIATLHLIQVDDSLRDDIMSASGTPETGDGGFPQGITNLIEGETPPNLNCRAKICDPTGSCELNFEIPKRTEIYIKETIISSSHNDANPKKIALFCWKD